MPQELHPTSQLPAATVLITVPAPEAIKSLLFPIQAECYYKWVEQNLKCSRINFYHTLQVSELFFHLFWVFLLLALLLGTKAKACVLSLFIIINLFGVEKLHEVKQKLSSKEVYAMPLDYPLLGTGAKSNHSERQIFHLILHKGTKEDLSSILICLMKDFSFRKTSQITYVDLKDNRAQ